MARASTPTLLALDRYAQLMGINPAHFNQAVGTSVMPISGCTDVWWQQSWMSHDRVAREELARTIATAERDIANAIGYWPGPKFIEEVHAFPRHHRREVFDGGMNVRGIRKGIPLKWGRLIQPGQRNIASVGTASVAGGELVFSDDDGDGYSETATITLATSLTEPCEIKVYFSGESTPEWEIRPHRSIAIAGGNVTIVFWAWQLIDPDNWDAFPTDAGVSALDLTAAIYVSEVDVYREYVDSTEPSAQFFWEPDIEISPFQCSDCSGAGCPTCSLITQDGCLFVRDVDAAIGVPVPAEYDSDEGQWEEQTFTECRAPDQIKIWYYAGDLDDLYLQHTTPTSSVRMRCDPLSDYWAETIAWLTTARLERNICSCGNLTALSEKMRRDMSFSPRDGGSFFIPDEILNNPFGTRYGEVMAWRRVSKLTKRKMEVAVI